MIVKALFAVLFLTLSLFTFQGCFESKEEKKEKQALIHKIEEKLASAQLIETGLTKKAYSDYLQSVAGRHMAAQAGANIAACGTTFSNTDVNHDLKVFECALTMCTFYKKEYGDIAVVECSKQTASKFER